MLQSKDLDGLVLNPGPSLYYLTGLTFHLMERPVVAIFRPGEMPVLILPELEQAKTSALPFPVQTFPFGEDPAFWPATFDQATDYARLAGKKIGIEPIRLRLLEYRYLESAAPSASFVSAQDVLAGLRMKKDKEEIAKMKKAVGIAQQALLNTIPVIHTGVSERAIASELTAQLLKCGSDPELPFTPIVSSGPNSANPHASPGDRLLENGDLLVIDWGAGYLGYCSDLTRTFAIGQIDPEYAHIAGLVEKANAAGQAAARPGIPAGDVDAAGRAVIDRAGYGSYFFHRIGHGLGLEGHEEPYIFGSNTAVLEPGNTFTIEPGIYLTGRAGVRIEDNMAITEDGAECLSDLPRQLFPITA